MAGVRSAMAILALFAVLASSVAQASTPLASLLVGRADLRAGYGKNVAPGYEHMPPFPDGSPIGSRILAQHGYLLSYSAQVTLYGMKHQIEALVTESGDKYRNVSGARWGFQRMVHARYPQSLSMPPLQVGNESAAFSAELPEPPGREIDVFFRRNNYVVRIALAAKSVGATSVLTLAKLVDKRIKKNG
jgi:hypothetical protein